MMGYNYRYRGKVAEIIGRQGNCTAAGRLYRKTPESAEHIPGRNEVEPAGAKRPIRPTVGRAAPAGRRRDTGA